MDALNKSIYVIELYEIYQDLLTKKQQEYIELYYYDNLSITEISENLEVSRNAVHDQLKRTVSKLEDLESKLNMRKNFELRSKLHKKLKEKTTDKEILSIVEDLEKVE